MIFHPIREPTNSKHNGGISVIYAEAWSFAEVEMKLGNETLPSTQDPEQIKTFSTAGGSERAN